MNLQTWKVMSLETFQTFVFALRRQPSRCQNTCFSIFSFFLKTYRNYSKLSKAYVCLTAATVTEWLKIPHGVSPCSNLTGTTCKKAMICLQMALWFYSEIYISSKVKHHPYICYIGVLYMTLFWLFCGFPLPAFLLDPLTNQSTV